MEKKIAQIWVETVVYTLIGISIIGIILAIAKPRIDEIRDRLLIEQTIESFNQIHSRIIEIQDSPGNQRTIGLKLSKGRITLDGITDEIRWEMESNFGYSQVGSRVSLGDVQVLTEESNPYKVSIFLKYYGYNITISQTDKELELEESPTPYTLILRNEGMGKINIDVKY